MNNYVDQALKYSIPTLVLCGFCYEFFFLLGLGIDLVQSPVGNSNLLRSWVELNKLAIFNLIGILILFIIERTKEYKTEDEVFYHQKIQKK